MIFGKRDKEIEKLFRKTNRDFPFNSSLVKFKLMARIKNNADLAGYDMPKLNFMPSRAYASGFALALVVAATTATLAYADGSKPGDQLFPLDRFQEKILLKLPLPVEKRSVMEARIVE